LKTDETVLKRGRYGFGHFLGIRRVVGSVFGKPTETDKLFKLLL